MGSGGKQDIPCAILWWKAWFQADLCEGGEYGLQGRPDTEVNNHSVVHMHVREYIAPVIENPGSNPGLGGGPRQAWAAICATIGLFRNLKVDIKRTLSST